MLYLLATSPRHVVIQICVFQSALSLDAAYDSVVLTPTTFRRSFRTSGHVCIPTWRNSCIAEFYGGPRALVLRASTCCAGLDRTLASIVGCCWWPRLRFLRMPACKAFAHLQHARLLVCLYRNLRRPFSFPSEERVGFPPWCRLAFMTIG